jgi:hypothetical protein
VGRLDPLKDEHKLKKLSQIFPWAEDQNFPTIFFSQTGFAEFASECCRFIAGPADDW